MQFSTVVLALAAATAASAGAVTSVITPTGSAPPSCTGTYSGNFEITVVKPAQKRDVVEKRDSCAGDGTLVIGLQNGVMTDAKGRTGYIASNYQFQFDGPPQAGAIYTAGFSVCGNSSIALGGSTVFYQCLSGGFYNLYSKHWAAQCEPVAIDVVPCGGSSVPTPAGSAPAGSAPAGSAPAASGAPAPASQITDGQPQAGSATPIPVSEFTDGQPQVPTALVSQITDGQPQAPTAAPAPAPSVATGAGAVVGVAQQVVLAAAGLAGVALL